MTTTEAPRQPLERSELLKSWALEEGFDRAGVARLERSDHDQALLEWLGRGDQAEMAYLERRVDCRIDPSRLLEGSQSAICVALHYWPLSATDAGADPVGDLWSKVARYARGDDYHDIMERRLRSLALRIEEAFPGTLSRPYVDTGPVLERELAQRAGLGRIGKNTNLLHKESSWFLLGELLLTLDLKPDEPLADMCGTCTQCLEACPTGALPEPYRLDSRQCISYWTIEHRGSLSEAARESLDDWIFGCDICQEVCPWNGRYDDAFDHPELSIPERRAKLDLRGLLGLSRERYVELFRRSPMKRAKLEGLKRNAAVALGHRGDPQDIRSLASSLASEPSVLVREHVAWALGKVAMKGKTNGAKEALRNALGSEEDTRVRSAISWALEHAADRVQSMSSTPASDRK